MRFDKQIELIANVLVEDGQGGRTEQQKVVRVVYANIEELSVTEAFKIYGEATTDSIKVRMLGRIEDEFDNIRYGEKLYKVISKRHVKNKTAFLLELIEDGN